MDDLLDEDGGRPTRAAAAGATVRRRQEQLLRVTWRSVASVVTRVVAEAAGRVDRLDGLRHVGIEEIAP